MTHGRMPGTITVAEESTAWPAVSRPTYVGGLGFTFKWNMGWMHDMLDYIRAGSGAPPLAPRADHVLDALCVHRELRAAVLARRGRARQAVDARQDAGRRLAEARHAAALYGYMFGHPGKKLMFMGGEFGQWREWNHDREPRLAPARRPAARRAAAVGPRSQSRLSARALAARGGLRAAGFSWIDCHDNENSVVSMIRRARDPRDFTVMVVNFTPVPRPGYRIGVPEAGWYREVLNSDAALYGGSNMGNGGGVHTDPIPRTAIEQSLSLRRPAARVCAAQEVGSRRFAMIDVILTR